MHMHMGGEGLHRGMSRDTERVSKEGERWGHNEARRGIYVYQRRRGEERRGMYLVHHGKNGLRLLC